MDKGEKGSDDENQDTRPRRPRRPRREDSKVDDSDQGRPAESKQPGQSQAPQAKPRRRRQAEEEDQGDGGWMGGAPDVKQKFEAEPEAVDVMATQNKDKHFNEDVSEIIIPDLDEDGGGESDQRVAHAPRNVSRKIPALSTLQHEAKTYLQTNKDGIDLSVLLGTLVPPNMLVEDDSLWTFESLLREVTEELHAMAKVKSNPAPSGRVS